MLKVCVICDSPLIESTLKRFLKGYITTYKECDIVIADRRLKLKKPSLVIGTNNAHIKKPFTRSSLILKIEKYEKEKIKKNSLETKIEIAALKFAKEIIKIIKSHS